MTTKTEHVGIRTYRQIIKSGMQPYAGAIALGAGTVLASSFFSFADFAALALKEITSRHPMLRLARISPGMRAQGRAKLQSWAIPQQ